MYTKWLPYEPSLRVPLLVSGPGIARSRVSDALVELIDLNPSLYELVGLPVPENLDARSFVPLLNGVRTEHRTDCISSIRNWRCIRTREHKLVENYNDTVELYDLTCDPDELHNVAAVYPDKTRELQVLMDDRFREGRWLR
jgi:choline-sulfatase